MFIWFVLVGAIYLMLISMIFKTEDIQSAVFFKLIPFLLGLGSLIYFLATKNYI